MGRFAEWKNGRKANKPVTIEEVRNQALEELKLSESVERQKELADLVLTLENARAKQREGTTKKIIVGGLISTIIPTAAVIFAEDIRPLPSKAWAFVNSKTNLSK